MLFKFQKFKKEKNLTNMTFFYLLDSFSPCFLTTSIFNELWELRNSVYTVYFYSNQTKIHDSEKLNMYQSFYLIRCKVLSSGDIFKYFFTIFIIISLFSNLGVFIVTRNISQVDKEVLYRFPKLGYYAVQIYFGVS